MEPLSLIAAFAPALVRGVNGLINRFVSTGSVKPATVEEAVSLQAAENDRLRIVLEADAKGETYRWVEAIRKLQRPVVVVVLLVAFVLYPQDEAIGNLFAVVMWYLFGERVSMLGSRPQK